MDRLAMFKVIRGWLHRYFSDEEAIVLVLLLVSALLVILFFGSILAPVFAGLGFAFILQGIVSWQERVGVPHMFAVSITFIMFLAIFLAFILLMMPLIWEQGTTLLNEFPRMITRGEEMLKHLPETYPEFISEAQVNTWVETASDEFAKFGQWLVSFSISKLPNVVGILIYVVLVPILVFFFLKDRKPLLLWLSGMLPEERRMIDQVSEEMSEQIANYIRGKVIEIIIVGVATYIAFAWLKLNYAALLALLVGLSVVIPYIGAAVVTIPVAVIGMFQFGVEHQFVVLMVVYGIIQTLDGNVLVPLLFSEAVNLHPVAIIIAVLMFGGIWGFWGVFFAIPLATLVKAVLAAWPKEIPLQTSEL